MRFLGRGLCGYVLVDKGAEGVVVAVIHGDIDDHGTGGVDGLLEHQLEVVW
jgi:hypothetical protein